ncbi:MAG: type I restriction endonuclease subunit R, partial [Roseicyclus sp.]
AGIAADFWSVPVQTRSEPDKQVGLVVERKRSTAERQTWQRWELLDRASMHATDTFFNWTRSRVSYMSRSAEAHRTQYGFESKLDRATGDLRRGLAWQLRRALPNAVYVAFTGSPVDLVGANTRVVFGDYIDVYDIAQAVEDGATVPIYYEARVAKIDLDEDVTGTLDAEFDEVTEDLEDAEVGAIARRWSRVEALVGAEARLDAVVADILQHFDARLEAIDGKAMIVCMSRRICVEVYDRIVAARPDWHGETDDTGAVKVVMTGAASDPQPFQPHIRPKARQEVLRKRFKDPADPLKLVIVRDMWLTGFDAPCMHTL